MSGRANSSPVRASSALRGGRLLVSLALAVLGGIALWQFIERGSAKTPTASSPPTPPRPGGLSDPNSLTVIERAQPRQITNFSLLRTPPEGLPASTQTILRRPAFGANWALAQRLSVAVPGDFWAIPGNGFLCVLAHVDEATAAGSCATTEDALAHGVSAVLIRETPSSEPARENRLIVGVAPDRAREVVVRTVGSETRVQVRDNVFMLRDSSTEPPETVILP